MLKNKIFLIFNILITTIILKSCNQPQPVENQKTASFKVWGNCEMCKKTIEGSLIQGVNVISRNWDQESKIMKVTFDSTQITLPEIHTKIAESGYDTDLKKGDTEAYESLPQCCQYTRKE